MIEVDTGSFFAIVLIAAIAAITVAAVPSRFAPPVVVVELILGILIGPELLDVAKTDDFIDFFSNLGLGMLFFFAGYEIDFERIKGKPLRLGVDRARWGASGALYPQSALAGLNPCLRVRVRRERRARSVDGQVPRNVTL